MRSSKPIFLISALMGDLINSGAGNSPKTPTAPPRLFEEAKRLGSDPGPYEFTLSIYGCSVTITSAGEGGRSCPGASPVKFHISVERDSEIGQLQFLNDKRTLFLIYELSDGESGWGKAVALNSALRVRWVRHIPDFNIARALVEGHFAYVSGVGFVAKLDLNTGRYVWRHAGLYRRQLTFEVPQPPNSEGKTVSFSSHDGNGRSRVLRIDKDTGRILSHR